MTRGRSGDLEELDQRDPPSLEALTEEVSVLYLDMLGFSALTESHPNAFSVNKSGSVVTTSITPAAARFNRFHRVLEQYVAKHNFDGPDRAIIFSDCAFLVFPNSLLAAIDASDLMKKFLVDRIPVRMGLGRGTCQAVRFTSDTIDRFNLTRAMFSGTGVVRSSKAEKSGKGCRIFAHPSLEGDLSLIERNIPVLPLSKPSQDAWWELCYLYDRDAGVTLNRIPAEMDLDLFNGVEEMRSENSAPADPAVCIQYRETIAALNRMRAKLSRSQWPVHET
jgi:hypothetical protein